jgi:hypothetical protein
LACSYATLAGTEKTSDPVFRLTEFLFDDGFLLVDFSRPEICDAKLLSQLLLRMDQGLILLEQGDASALLALPTGLTSLVENSFRSGTSANVLRLKIASVAADLFDPVPWILTLESLFESTEGETRSDAAGLLSLLYAQNGQLDLADIMLDTVSRTSPARVTTVVAYLHARLGSPALALQVTEEELGEGANVFVRVLRLAVRCRVFLLLERNDELRNTMRELESVVFAARTELSESNFQFLKRLF